MPRRNFLLATLSLLLLNASPLVAAEIPTACIKGSVTANGVVTDNSGAIVARLDQPAAQAPDHLANLVADRLTDLRSAVVQAQSYRQLTTAQGADYRASLDNISQIAGMLVSHGARLTFDQTLTLSKELDIIAASLASTARITPLPSLLVSGETSEPRLLLTIDPSHKAPLFKTPLNKKPEKNDRRDNTPHSAPADSRTGDDTTRSHSDGTTLTPADEIEKEQALLLSIVKQQESTGKLDPAEAKRWRDDLEQISFKLGRYRADHGKPRQLQALLAELQRVSKHLNPDRQNVPALNADNNKQSRTASAK